MKGAFSILNMLPEKRKPVEFSYVPMSDAEALRSDWETVGKDLRFTLNKFQKDYGKNFTRG